MDNIKNLIKDFLEGKIDIIEFKELCDRDDSIYFLTKIIDEIKENNDKIDNIHSLRILHQKVSIIAMNVLGIY